MNLSAAYLGSNPVQVDFNGTVASEPSYFLGTHTHCRHEQFAVSSPAGPVEIIDNVALAPPVPVHVGDHVEVSGEMVHDPGKPPIVHWTHHDPSHHHPDGFIRLHGRVYA
jgi:hypothetical protein